MSGMRGAAMASTRGPIPNYERLSVRFSRTHDVQIA